MEIKQIYSLVNAISHEAFGETSLVAHDLQGLISMGEELSEFGQGTRSDVYLKTLVDRIARTIVRKLDLPIEFPEIITDNFNYGCVLQKISVDPMDAVDYEPSKIGENGYTPNQFAIHKPTVRQNFFEKTTAFSIKVTIPDDLFASAFTSEQAMASFVEGITASLVDSMTLKINDVCRTAVVNLIGEKIYTNRNVVHLITEYNHVYSPSTPLTEDTAMINPEFIRFATKRMGDMLRYMERPSSLFNENGVIRATRRDNMHSFLLGEFAAASKIYLQADTFWKELVQLPLFKEVTFWQGMAGETDGTVHTMPDFTTASTIKLAKLASSTNSTTKAVNQSGVIGAFIDREAIGTTIFKRNTSTDRNNDAEYTNYSSKAKMGFYNDIGNENAVVFVLD